jgi:hypothetical protein
LLLLLEKFATIYSEITIQETPKGFRNEKISTSCYFFSGSSKRVLQPDSCNPGNYK